FNACCMPFSAPWPNCITNSDPLFVDAAAGDFHLQTNSPCINAGYNGDVATGTDLDGNPRIAGGTVDIGTYEVQVPASVISYAWLQSYGFPTDGSADYADPDEDGMNNWSEWRARTNPTKQSSSFKILSASPSSSGTSIRWTSVS